MKRIISVITAILMLFLLMTSCSSNTTSTEPETKTIKEDTTNDVQETAASETEKPAKVETVTFFSSIGAYKTFLEERITQWNETVGAEKGIFLQIETNTDNFNEALDLALSAGNAADMFMMPYANRVKGGYVACLDDIPEVQETLDIYREVLVPGLNTIEEKAYSIPVCIFPFKLSYNKDLFVKNNIVDESGEAKPPETLAELVEDAKIITQNGNGQEYGYGMSLSFIFTFQRLIMEPYMMTTGAGWFDNKNLKYNFEPFSDMFSTIKQLVDDGSVFPGFETISYDTYRAQFAEGNIGMIVSPAYDVGLFDSVFPAKCDWGVCDVPQLTKPSECEYKGIGYVGIGTGINSAVSDSRMWAVAEAWNLINGLEMNAELFATGNLIPLAPRISEYAKENYEFVDMKNWDVMSDISYYTYMPEFPDTLLILEGDNSQITFSKYLFGEMTLDEMIGDLNERYNAALQQGLNDGTIGETDYHYDPNLER